MRRLVICSVAVATAAVVNVASSGTKSAYQVAAQTGLRAAAAAAGGSFVTMADSDTQVPISMEQLAGISETVAIGVPLRNGARLSADGKSIFTFYEVSLVSVLKGSDLPDTIITVAVPGGRVKFGENSWAQVTAPGFRKPVSSRQYLFFLRKARRQVERNQPPRLQGGRVFEVAFGGLGLYDIDDPNREVVPTGMTGSQFGREMTAARMDSRTFLALVKAAIKTGWSVDQEPIR